MGGVSTGFDLYDLYALAGERSPETVTRFRDRWLTDAEPSADEYEFPLHSDRPDAVYSSPWQLIDRLLAIPQQRHSIYWTNRDPGDLRNAMLFFTTDGGLIAGLTVETDEPSRASTMLRQLAESLGARYGYAACEEPPPDTTSEFKARAREGWGYESVRPIVPPGAEA